MHDQYTIITPVNWHGCLGNVTNPDGYHISLPECVKPDFSNCTLIKDNTVAHGF